MGWIITSAIVVGGLYIWRLLSGTPARAKLSPSSIAGKSGELVSPEGFLIAWGIVYIALSIAAGFFPKAAGAMAVLVMIADILANGPAALKSAEPLERSGLSSPSSASSSRASSSSAKRPHGNLPRSKSLHPPIVKG